MPELDMDCNYREEMQGEFPRGSYYKDHKDWSAYGKFQPTKRCCFCCRNEQNYSKMLDYDYKKYRRSDYGNIFRKADLSDSIEEE